MDRDDFLTAGHDRSGVTVAGAKDVAVANDTRRALTFQNTSDTDMWLCESGAVAAVGTGYKLAAGQAANVSTSNRVSVYCASAGKTYSATEV